jgi:hypothetical protein
MYGTDRAGLREVFFRAWRKYRAQEPLEGIERLVVDVALRHPEYHTFLDDPESHAERDFFPELGETNPFLHLAMHLAIEEGLAIDQPRGLRDRYRALLGRQPDEHAAQHSIMECLGEMLWRAQRTGTPPDEAAFLRCVDSVEGATRR